MVDLTSTGDFDLPAGPLARAVDFEDIFTAYWPRIHRFAIAIVGDPAEAEDISLEAFYRLYRRPRLLARGQNPLSWLYRVAGNLGYNALRSAKRRGRYEQAAAPLAGAAGADDPEEKLAQTETAAAVRSVLAVMKPRSARLLLLREQGLKYRELAAVLRVRPGSIGPLLTRAEREFREKYENMFGS